jgi:hypothetical protein
MFIFFIALNRSIYKTQSSFGFGWTLCFNGAVFLFDFDKIQSHLPAAQAGEAYTLYSIARGAAAK